MAERRDTLVNLEYQRQKLEESITELKKTLYKWRLQDAEYDALKEEIGELRDDCTRDDFLRVAREFGGSLVTETEIKILMGEHMGIRRSRQQVIDGISKRSDYVQQNISVLEKRLADKEERLEAILAVEQPSSLNEEGLPITDIVEELDDDDRVISGRTTTPGQSAPELLQVLKKAGIRDIPEGGQVEGELKQDVTTTKEKEKNGASMEMVTSPKVEDVSSPPGSTTTTTTAVSNTSTRGSIQSTTMPSENDEDSPVITAIDESPEDAKLRREMLQYGLEEVGAVVAELELDESGSEFSYDDDDWTDEDEAEEDEYGRSRGRVLDEDYHRQMRELEQKLNAKSLLNIGPDASALPSEVQQQLEEPKAPKEIVPNLVNGTKANGTTKKKKKVAFADELDIAPDPAASKVPPSPHPAKMERGPEPPAVAPVQEAIVERTEKPKPTDTPQDQPTKKTSRFKSARKAAEPTVTEAFASSSSATPAAARPKPQSSPLPLFPAKPSSPKPFSQPIIDRDVVDDRTRDSAPLNAITSKPKLLANTLVERSVNTENVIPPDPDDLDESLHQQEIATEFYKLQNRKIFREGGFLQEDEEAEAVVRLDDEADEAGEPRKRVSRFMAARMK